MNWRVTAAAAGAAIIVVLAFNLLPSPWGPLIVGLTVGAGFAACYDWGRRTALVLRFHGGPRDGDVFRLPAPDIVTVPLPDGGGGRVGSVRVRRIRRLLAASRRLRLATYSSESQYCAHLEAITAELRNRGVEVEHHHGYQNRRAFTDKIVLVASRKDAGFLADRNIILVEHGAGQRYNRDAGSGGPDHEDRHVVLFLAPSQRVADNGKPLYPRAKRLAVGSPRVEQLSLLPRSPEYVVTAWHWNAPGVPEAKSAWERYKVAVRDLAKQHPVLGHGHPRTKTSIGKQYREWGISQEWEWAECVKQAKALTCDNSSVMWEAAALDIPVVVINAPWYRREVEWGLRFWEYADVGPQVDTPAGLAEAVRLVLEEDRWKARRAEISEALYGQIEGSTGRACDAIMEVIG